MTVTPQVDSSAPPGTLARSPFWHPFSNIASAAVEVVLARAEGSRVWDEAGREYLDATAALWYCNVGYGRRSIVDAAQRQLAELPAYSAFGAFANRPALDLSKRIVDVSPLADARVFLTLGGSDAIETAAKLARRYWNAVGKPEKKVIVSRELAYHGMHTYGTSLGGVPGNAEGLGELVADVLRVGVNDAGAVERLLERRAAEIAAFIGEPVVGAGGVVPPASDYWNRVAAACRRHDVLLISDEVITGWGRTGALFGCQRYGFEPDLIAFAKGVTSGYLPLGGVIAGARVQEPFATGDGIAFRHGYTYSGHAACCAAGLANLDILLGEDLPSRVANLEPTFGAIFTPLAELPAVREVRLAGLLAGVELVETARLEATVDALRERGVLTRGIGGTSLQVSPALTISEQELKQIADAFRDVLA